MAIDGHLAEIRKMYGRIGFHDRASWKSAPAVYGENSLKIHGHPVMEDWEAPYMKRMAEIATSNGGHVLEVGFGMGISAGFIQNSGVESHTIIEANHEVAERARAASHGAPCRVTVLEGLWEEVIDKIPDASLDGIFYDAYPLEESEVWNQARFAPTAFRKLREGGVFTYFSNEISDYRTEHLAKLLDAGFSREKIGGVVVEVAPPEECLYWKDSTIMAPIVTK